MIGPSLQAYERDLQRRLANPTSRPMVLTIVNARDSVIYEITIEKWDGGVSLSALTTSNGLAIPVIPRIVQTRPQFVRVSPQSFADSARSAALNGDFDSAKRLLQPASLFYPQSNIASRIQGAINDGTSAAIGERLSRAAQYRSAGDWRNYAGLLSETLSRFPQSREKVEITLSTDLQRGRDALRTGDGSSAVAIAGWIASILPEFAPARIFQAEAKSQVAADALRDALASETKGAFDQEQVILVTALRIVPEDQQLQAKLRSIQDRLEAADRQKIADARQAADRAAAGRRATDLADALTACRTALDRKEFTLAIERCTSLIGTYPQESAAKILVSRLRVEVPLRECRSHAEAEQVAALSGNTPSSITVGKVGIAVDWHGRVRTKTVDNYYVIDTSSGSFVVRQKAGERALTVGLPVAVIGKIGAWPTIGTLAGRPQVLPLLQPDRIDQ